MLVRCLAAIAFFIGVGGTGLAPARADITVVPDPGKWIEQGLKDIAQGKTDEFARSFLALIDKSNNFDQFAEKLRVLQQFGAPVFMERVVDEKYGGTLREIIYVALYRQAEYMYFRFIMKKNADGWLITDFSFRPEVSELFPKDFRR